MNSKRPRSGDNARPENLEEDEAKIREDEDYRVWCRQDGEQVIIRQRKVYLQKQVQWIFEIGDAALDTLRSKGLRANQIGVMRYSGASLIRFIDSMTEISDG